MKYLILEGSYSDTPIYVPDTPRNKEIMVMFIRMTQFTSEGGSTTAVPHHELTPEHIQQQIQHKIELQMNTDDLYTFVHTPEGLNQPWNYLFYLQLGYLYMGKTNEKSLECNILAHTNGLQQNQYGYAGIGLYNIAKLRKEMNKVDSNQYFDRIRNLYTTDYNPSLQKMYPHLIQSPLYFNVSLIDYYRNTDVDELLEESEKLFIQCNKTRKGWYNTAQTLRLQELQQTRQFTKLSSLAEAMLQVDKYNQRALAELGILSFTLGQRDKALDYWLRALSASLSRNDSMSMYAIMDALISQLSIESMTSITIPILQLANIPSNIDNGSNGSIDDIPILDHVPFYNVLTDYLRGTNQYAKYFHRIVSPKLPLPSTVPNPLSLLPSCTKELYEHPLLPIFSIRDIFKRTHTALLITKAAAVGASFQPSTSSEMEAMAFTLIRLCNIVTMFFHPLSPFQEKYGKEYIENTLRSLPYPLNDYEWSHELYGVCSSESWPLHAYWYVHMGRSRLPILMQDSTLMAMINSKSAIRPKGYLLPSSLLLTKQRTVLRHRPLHAGISSYDFRTHAFGFIVEGLLRHTRKTKLKYSLWFLGPADKSSVSYLNYSNTIYCKEELRYIDNTFLQPFDCSAEPLYGNKALAVIPRILNDTSLAYILSMNATTSIVSDTSKNGTNSHSQTDTLVSIVPESFYDVTPDAQGWAVARTMAMMNMDILVDAMGATFGNRVDVIDALHSKSTSSIHAVILQNIPSTSSSDDAMTTDSTIVPPESFGTRLTVGLYGSSAGSNSNLPIVSALLEPRIIYVRHTWLLSDFSRYLVSECFPKIGNNQQYGCLPLPQPRYVESHIPFSVMQSNDMDHELPFPVDLPRMKLGGLQSFDKLDDQVITLWANILHASSNSILVLLNSTNPYASERIKEELLARGIHPYRIQMLPGAPHAKHIRRLPYVADLILDTTMCNGHTTTADALYGGVPVLTLEGDVLHNRVASSLIKTAQNGLSRVLVTYTVKEYETVGVRLSRYNEQYYLLRTLRQRILHASLSSQTPSVYAPTQADDVNIAHRTLLEVMAAASSPPYVPNRVVGNERTEVRNDGLDPPTVRLQNAPYGYDCHMIVNTKDKYIPPT